jgi:hypothetical protein
VKFALSDDDRMKLESHLLRPDVTTRPITGADINTLTSTRSGCQLAQMHTTNDAAQEAWIHASLAIFAALTSPKSDRHLALKPVVNMPLLNLIATK